MTMRREDAEFIIRNNGWLRLQPPAFQDDVLRSSLLQRYEQGRCIFRLGDEPGGIYGLVAGNFSINTAPPGGRPKLIHMSMPGFWTGEGCFFTRQPRRAEMRAIVPTWVLHLPLAQMDRIAYENPECIRNFCHILMHSMDMAIRIIHDLQHPDPGVRIAAALDRAMTSGSPALNLTQAKLGEMACATRRQVNRVLHEFEEKGWVKCAYRGILVVDATSIQHFIDYE